MRCAVLNCGNNNNSKACEHSFFTFPSDIRVQKQWVKFCRRKDEFNVKTSYICMLHFKDEDFENNLKYRLGFTKKRLLKRGAVPSVRIEDVKNAELHEKRKARVQKRENKKIVDDLLRQHNLFMEANQNNDALMEQEEVDIKTEVFASVEQTTDEESIVNNLPYHEQINEDVFEANFATKCITDSKECLKSIGSQTNFYDAYACAFVTVTCNFMTYNVNCFYCDACFSIRDWDKFMNHVGSQHRYKITSYFETADVNGNPKETTNAIEEDAMQQFDVFNDAEDDGMVQNFEEHNVNYEFVPNLSPKHEDDIDEFFKNQLELDTVQSLKKSNNQINVETSDASLVSFIIDLLQSDPTVWFINANTKQYKKGFINLYKTFSEKYALMVTQKELHESLINIRDWYQTIFEQRQFDKLSYPQSEYYRKLAAFLPDKSNGKTCELCERIFDDHVQYFAHKKLEHKKPLSEDNEEPEAMSLAFLKERINDYFKARYQRYQPGRTNQCQICPKNYYRRNALFEHIRTHLDICGHVCHICGKTFIKKQNFAQHKERHFGFRKWKCLICGKAFKTCTALTNHRKRYHRPIEGKIEEIDLQMRHRLSRCYVAFTDGHCTRYACLFCEKKFEYKKDAQKHYNHIHKIKKLKDKSSGTEKSEEKIIEEYINDIEVDIYLD